jgi:hypothetical protein
MLNVGTTSSSVDTDGASLSGEVVMFGMGTSNSTIPPLCDDADCKISLSSVKENH